MKHTWGVEGVRGRARELAARVRERVPDLGVARKCAQLGRGGCRDFPSAVPLFAYMYIPIGGMQPCTDFVVEREHAFSFTCSRLKIWF